MVFSSILSSFIKYFLLSADYGGKKLYYSTNNVKEKSWDGLINQNLDMMFVFRKVIQEFGIAYSDAFKTHQKCYPNLYFKENQ